MTTPTPTPTPTHALPPPLRDRPTKLFVETTSRCNLTCAMCVKQTDPCGSAEGDLSPALFAALEPAFAGLEALILNGVGEPLLHPHLEDFIRRAKQAMPAGSWIGFQSNGVLLSSARARALAAAGLDRICLSVDAVTPETFGRMRQGGELSGVERALAALRQAKQQSGRSDLQVGVEMVLTRATLAELPATLAWAAERGADFAIVTHLLPYDAEHAAQGAYLTVTDAAIDHFQQWQAKARRQGIALERYFEILFKFDKNPQDKAIVAFVEEMKAAAAEDNLFLDLSKLFALDSAWLQQLAEVFAAARAVADGTGLDLQLPRIVPKEERLCHFVEDGGAFISWQGEVHPCYFLWHRFNCFASGWDQPIKPRVFGDLAERDILAIWNDPAFATFRRNVIQYDYPFCISCRLAPCDYVQTDQFEQDCHVRAEPCGSCLWCMGLFQCLR